MYERRIEWLSLASRRIWGTVCEKRYLPSSSILVLCEPCVWHRHFSNPWIPCWWHQKPSLRLRINHHSAEPLEEEVTTTLININTVIIVSLRILSVKKQEKLNASWLKQNREVWLKVTENSKIDLIAVFRHGSIQGSCLCMLRIYLHLSAPRPSLWALLSSRLSLPGSRIATWSSPLTFYQLALPELGAGPAEELFTVAWEVGWSNCLTSNAHPSSLRWVCSTHF